MGGKRKEAEGGRSTKKMGTLSTSSQPGSHVSWCCYTLVLLLFLVLHNKGRNTGEQRAHPDSVQTVMLHLLDGYLSEQYCIQLVAGSQLGPASLYQSPKEKNTAEEHDYI